MGSFEVQTIDGKTKYCVTTPFGFHIFNAAESREAVISDIDNEPKDAWAKGAWTFRCENLHIGQPIELAVINPRFEPDWVVNEDGSGWMTSDLDYDEVVYVIDGQFGKEVDDTVWDFYHDVVLDIIRENYEED